MASIFGIIVPGQLPFTNFQQVDANKWSAIVEVYTPTTEVMFFLTGVTPLPDSMGATLMFSFDGNDYASLENATLTTQRPSTPVAVPWTNTPLRISLGILLDHLSNLPTQPSFRQPNGSLLTEQEVSEYGVRVATDLVNYLSSFEFGGNFNLNRDLPSLFEKWLKRFKEKSEREGSWWRK